MLLNDRNGIGRVEVETLPLPVYVRYPEATYLFSGKVFVSYRTDQDWNQKEFHNFAVVNDDGSDFTTIFSGVVKEHPKSNGIRYLPYPDNTRVLLGDYVLEGFPNLDETDKAELVPIRYPEEIDNNPAIERHYSEIIISPNNKHMAFTILTAGNISTALIGCLNRKKDHYAVEDVQIISTSRYVIEDPKKEGFLLPQLVRGGEVKQFIRGGRAISLVGQKEGSTPNSVVQALDSEELTQITFMPGYDETTIFSPDEKLGMVMTTRFSSTSNPAIFGLIPRPHGVLTSSGITFLLYLYSVAGVRAYRNGNIGPALIEIERSMNEPGYLGVPLYDPKQEWIYLSPMSWHPGGKKAMFLETLRADLTGDAGTQTRVRIVKLLDYQPAEAIWTAETPDEIPYASKDLSILNKLEPKDIAGKIAGKHSGYIDYMAVAPTAGSNYTGKTRSCYHNFSDDGVNFYNGYETVDYSYLGTENRYEADIKLTGEKLGEMKCQATFSGLSGATPLKLLFEADKDGNPKSYGFAEYNGTRLNMEDLSE